MKIMDRRVILLLISVFFAACNGSSIKVTPKDNTQNYEEFTVDDNNNESNLNDLQSDQQTDNQIFTLSTQGLNQYLATPDQTVIFSFKTKNGKVMSLLTDDEENYLVYRFGKPDKIELQYPETVTSDSWQKFYFEGYKSSAVNLMHIIFTNTNYQYIIYYNKFYATPEDNKIGVQVVGSNGNKVDIRADMNSVYGGMNFFRTNEKIRRIPN